MLFNLEILIKSNHSNQFNCKLIFALTFYWSDLRNAKGSLQTYLPHFGLENEVYKIKKSVQIFAVTQISQNRLCSYLIWIATHSSTDLMGTSVQKQMDGNLGGGFYF